MPARRLKVAIYGLGQIGIDIARLTLLQSHLQLVGAIERDPAKLGTPLSTITGDPRAEGIPVREDAAEALREWQPDVVVVVTTPRLREILPQVRLAMANGAAVVSTCEEMVYPYARYRDLALELHDEAVKAGVGLLSIGINPGFIMDLVPVLLTAPCLDIKAIRVTRTLDASGRRQAFINRLGVGLAPALAPAQARAGAGPHTGLVESLSMIGDALSWQIDRVVEHAEPVIAQDWIRTPYVTVAPGQIMGYYQEARGYVGRREAIELRWRATVGERDPHDSIFIDGQPTIDLRINNGIHGDLATAALATRAIPAIAAAAPGLHTVLDLPILHYIAPPWRGGRYAPPLSTADRARS